MNLKLYLLFFSLTSYAFSDSLFSLSQNTQFNLLPMNVQETLMANITQSDAFGAGTGYESTLQYQNGAPISGTIPLYLMYLHTFDSNMQNTPFIFIQIGTSYALQMNPAILMSLAQNPQSLLSLYTQTYYKFGIGLYY
ncbi:MAG: hypothetical protein NTX05_06135 [Fusobacteria bacterium]|nr:hypothetical protein [Fusobacteriota bacterium]